MPENDKRNEQESNPLDLGKYTIDSPKEIVHILRAVEQKNSLVTAYFNQGRDFILTSILDVDTDDDTVVLDYGAADDLNRKILDAEKINFVTSQDKVKVQFTASHIAKIRFNERNAFQIDLPESLVKLQRREFYRLSTPLVRPLKCVIALPDGSKAEATVVDISVGGAGMVAVPPQVSQEPGETYHDCRIALPEIGMVIATMQVRNAYEVTLKSGSKAKRSGWQFVNLPASAQVLIQRYIIKLDRERRSRAMDQ